MEERIKKEELEESLNDADRVFNSLALSLRRGLNTEEETDREIGNTIDDHFEKFVRHGKGLSWLSVRDGNAYKRFLADYDLWKAGKEPQSEVGEWWLTCHEYNAPDQEASCLDKSHFFELMDFFCFPVDYFEPYPEGTPISDERGKMHHGRDAILIGYNIWKDDGGLLRDDFQMGESVVITDHYGLRTFLKVEAIEESQYGVGNKSFRGEGWVEGYTTDRPREIWVSVAKGQIESVYVKIDEDDDKVRWNFPLWKEANECHERRLKIWKGIIRAIREKYGINAGT